MSVNNFHNINNNGINSMKKNIVRQSSIKNEDDAKAIPLILFDSLKKGKFK